MSYYKLALLNMKKSLRNYSLYILTLLLTSTCIYSFISLALSKDILSLSENFEIMMQVMIILSALVAIICKFIVSHSLLFILSQRKKEFATYMLMGMDKIKLIKLFFLENLLISLITLTLGIIMGNFISGFFVSIIYKVFGYSRNIEINLSIGAIIVTILLFLFITLIGLTRAIKSLSKSKIIDLLYDNQKNEIVDNRKYRFIFLRIILGIILLVVCCFSIYMVSKIQSNLAVIYLIITIVSFLGFIYFIYLSLPIMLKNTVEKKSSWYFKNTNMFLLGQLSKNILSSGKSMAVTSILLAISLTSMFIGLVMGSGYKDNIEADYPYDIAILFDSTVENFDEVIEFVDNKYPVKDSTFYNLYNDQKYDVDIISISDYNKLRTQLGLDEKELYNNSYFIHCESALRKNAENFINENKSISLGDTSLTNIKNSIYTDYMNAYKVIGSNGWTIIVPDSVANQLSANKSRLTISLEKESTPEIKSELNEFIRNEWDPNILNQPEGPITMGIIVKSWGVVNSMTGFITISFAGLYLCMIFIILSANLLAFEQLSSVNQSKKSYKILNSIGVSRKEQSSLILKESINIFIFPCIGPIFFISVIAYFTNYFLGKYIYSPIIIPMSLMITLSVSGVIYSVYFYISFKIYKRNVL